MEYTIPKVPTAEDIAAMTEEEKKAKQDELERVMLLEAASYKEWEAKRVAAQERFDAAYADWKEANQSRFADLDEAKTEARLSQDFLQQAAVARRLLTGDKTWKAFQAAEVRQVQYDAGDMYNWVLNEAPGDIRRHLLDLNTKNLNQLFLERAEENGVIKSYEGAEAIPGLVIKTYTGKILSDKLKTLRLEKSDMLEPPTSKDVPVKMIQSTSDPVEIRFVDPTRTLTQDEVRKHIAESEVIGDLLQTSQQELIRVAALPVAEPVPPPPDNNDDIPF